MKNQRNCNGDSAKRKKRINESVENDRKWIEIYRKLIFIESTRSVQCSFLFLILSICTKRKMKCHWISRLVIVWLFLESLCYQYWSIIHFKKVMIRHNGLNALVRRTLIWPHVLSRAICFFSFLFRFTSVDIRLLFFEIEIQTRTYELSDTVVFSTNINCI